MKYNKNFNLLSKSYVFQQQNEQIKLLKNAGYNDIINLGIGDIRQPICNLTADAMAKACKDMTTIDGFRGYSPLDGYEFLKKSIQKMYSFEQIDIDLDEIFITNGAKDEIGNILELFDNNLDVLFFAPCYPASVESNILRGNKIHFMQFNSDNSYPSPNYDKDYDIIYVCSPNNPNGSVINDEKLCQWINYAIAKNAIIIYDNAYSVFLDEKSNKSAYKLINATKCVIEVNSFSKSLGFTGVRCGWTIIPKQHIANKFYKRRLGARHNGVSYITQCGANAIFCRSGRLFIEKRINEYKQNLKRLKQCLDKLQIQYSNSNLTPYLYAKTGNLSSVEYCNSLLKNKHIVATPSLPFYQEGYFRLSAFANKDEISVACQRLLGQ